MASTQRYNPDSDPREYSEALVVNISDEPVRVVIGTAPNSRPRVYPLAPFGKSGDRVNVQSGYVHPYKGAGRQMCEPIIERLTMRHVGQSDGPRLPMVVHIDKAPTARAKWLAALAALRNKPRTQTLMVEVNEAREPVRAEIKTAPEPVKFIGEEVGQDEIEPPHPADVDDVNSDVVADGPPASEPVEEIPLRNKRGKA